MNKSVGIALFISVIAIVWILSGQVPDKEAKGTDSTLTSEAAMSSQEDKTTIPEVRVKQLTAEKMEDYIEISGRTQASRLVTLRSETDGTVAKLLAVKGNTLSQGQDLLQLEVGDRSAKLAQAKQLLQQRQIEYDASRDLAEKGFNSRVRLAEKQADLESAKAQLKQAQEEINYTRIQAPFAGVINNQMVEIGDYVSKGTPLFELVDLKPMEISGFLTEKQIGHAQEGDVAEAVLLNGQIVKGKISFIASAADSNTRTFAMEITVPNDTGEIKDGLTTTILLPYQEEKAYKISPSILSLADNGTIGVKIVGSDNKVMFMPVDILKDTPDYIWISGLPESVTLITVGQEFVIDGQQVKPVTSEEAGLL